MSLNAWLRLIGVLVFGIVPVHVSAQTPPPPSTKLSSHVAQLVALRDSFVNQIKVEGFQPSLPPPDIILDNPASYGAYESAKNVVHVAVWEELEPEQQAQFAGLFGQGQTADQAFDKIVHCWVFTHELGHWWQACQHKTGDSHYSEESGASRIAAAYWRLKDANFMDSTAKRIAAVRANTQNLVPQDQQSEKYFNENYEKLGPTPGFIWFQCDIVPKVLAERPLPSFRQTLQQPVYR
jgi:hypothetical protein